MIKKLNKIPVHVGIILDGNGRWAIKRGLQRWEGHKKAIDTIKKLIQFSKKVGIKYLTLYAFSTENWNRPKQEIDVIFDLINKNILENAEYFIKNDIKVTIFGDITKLSEVLQKNIIDLIDKTKNAKTLQLNICLNYGAKQEIIRAANHLLHTKQKEITEQDFKKELYSKDIPDLDFIIRTSGEKRLSNFMLFQSAYAELYFPKTLLPDFTEKKYYKALLEYQKRKRRFGGLKNN